MLWTIAKHIHVTCVLITVSLFLFRVTLVFAGKNPKAGVLRFLPHINDSLLLASAITLAVITHQYPFTHPWLTGKFFGLVSYIIFGVMTFKEAAMPVMQRGFYCLLALLSVAYIIHCAITRSPIPFSL